MTEVPPSIALIKEWSIWLVSIQTAALGLLTFTVKEPSTALFNSKSLFTAIVFFSLSILTASWTLSALPEMVTRMSKPNGNIHDMSMFINFPVPLWVFTSAQHCFFIIGLIFFSYAIIKRIRKV